MEYIDNYSFEPKPIGQGSFSQVYMGVHNVSKKKVAIKKINITFTKNLSKERVHREIDIMKNLNHPNIVSLYEAVPDKYNNIYLIMEYCPNGNFASFLNRKPLKEKYARRYMRQLMEATRYLYDNKILHRDIKPHNILLTENNTLKLTDFGFAKIFHNDTDKLSQTICGSPIYMAPEIIKCNHYSIKTDLWSLGVLLYEMIIGTPPYKANNHIQLIQMIESKPIYIPLAILISHECRNLINGLLQKNPDERISWEDFFDHLWFQESEEPVNLNLNELIVDYDYKAQSNVRIVKELRVPQSQPIDIKRSQSSSSIDDELTNSNSSNEFEDSYASPIFNSPLMFTPNDKTGYAIVEPKKEEYEGEINTERTITGSLINYMSNGVNYLKTYYW